MLCDVWVITFNIICNLKYSPNVMYIFRSLPLVFWKTAMALLPGTLSGSHKKGGPGRNFSFLANTRRCWLMHCSAKIQMYHPTTSTLKVKICSNSMDATLTSGRRETQMQRSENSFREFSRKLLPEKVQTPGLKKLTRTVSWVGTSKYKIVNI